MQLGLHEFHQQLNARFTTVNGVEVVEDYGDWVAEYRALNDTAGLIDLSCRSRLVLTGADRVRLLNGQVTNNVKDLPVGKGCYAALITNKGKMQADAFIYQLPNEILLDLEPGRGASVAQRLEGYIIADDVQVMDVAPHYGLLSVLGAKAWEAVEAVALGLQKPAAVLDWSSVNDATLGEVYCMNQPRAGGPGFDLFVPTNSMGAVADKLIAAVRDLGGQACGWRALDTARFEAGIPRFGVEMDETNLPPEAGLDKNAISYAKGCYIGQEVIARIRTYGQVAKALRWLRLPERDGPLPAKGDKIFVNGKEAGYVVNAMRSPRTNGNLGMGYVRREHNKPGSRVVIRTAAGEIEATVDTLAE